MEHGVFEVVIDVNPRPHLSAKEISTKLVVVNPDAPSMLDHILGLLVIKSLAVPMKPLRMAPPSPEDMLPHLYAST